MIDPKRFENEGQENESDLHANESTFSQAVVWGTDWTTETILSQLKRGNIELNPAFQRRDAWGRPGKSKFIESLILGLPIPQIILAESKDRRGTFIVIDGKQRLLSIRTFFAEDDDAEFDNLRLIDLEILNELKGKTYQEIKNDPSLESYLIALENQTIRTTIIRNWPNEAFLFTVFLRLNNGSVKLSPQELRQALHPGRFITFADELSLSSQAIKNMLNISKPDARMRDVELVVRFFSFRYFIDDYRGNLKQFFDETVNRLNNDWANHSNQIISISQELENAINATLEIFGQEAAFSKWIGNKFQNTFNRAIFDIMTYYFSFDNVRNQALQNMEVVIDAFKNLSDTDPEFVRAFETSTKNMEPTFKRFTTWGLKLYEILQTPISVPTLDRDRGIVSIIVYQ
jgi:hypothetical protein